MAELHKAAANPSGGGDGDGDGDGELELEATALLLPLPPDLRSANLTMRRSTLVIASLTAADAPATAASLSPTASRSSNAASPAARAASAALAVAVTKQSWGAAKGSRNVASVSASEPAMRCVGDNNRTGTRQWRIKLSLCAKRDRLAVLVCDSCSSTCCCPHNSCECQCEFVVDTLGRN